MEKSVVELFAGVGGFRVGLNNITEMDENGRAVEEGPFTIVWANQWEPSTKIQHAYDCYVKRFGEEHTSNCDISKVDKSSIPTHTLLVGGFPCQDYSVARTISNERGIEGKKGVLWWEIRNILENKKPPFVLLENVDRLLKSPASQRGRDFGIMLFCFNELGYDVEWRVVNAADYGMPQRRKRLYIFAYKTNTKYAKKMARVNGFVLIGDRGIMATTFPVEPVLHKTADIDIRGTNDLVNFSKNFETIFKNAGIMRHGIICTGEVTPIKSNSPMVLQDVLEKKVDESYYLTEKQKKQFEYMRGSKKILRTAKSGYQYLYSEGAMKPYDDLSLPGRTMLTSEGSSNRSTHIIVDPTAGRLRFLTPIECERLNQFPDNWTNTGMSKSRRCFIMGNALVCGVIKRLGESINEIIEGEK